MLFASLQRQTQGGTPRRIRADADEAARQCASVRLFGREKRSVRTAEAHRHAEALCAANGDFETKRTGRGQ